MQRNNNKDNTTICCQYIIGCPKIKVYISQNSLNAGAYKVKAARKIKQASEEKLGSKTKLFL